MFKFCFNDCLPLDRSEYEVTLCFSNSLKEYKELRTKYSDEVNGIVTSKLLHDIPLNTSGYNLANCIDCLSDKELKKYAGYKLSWFIP
jgi:hypothetical protein